VDIMPLRDTNITFIRWLLNIDTEKPNGLLANILEIMGTVGAEAYGGACFVHACLFLASAVEGDEDLCNRFRKAGVMGTVSQCLLWGTTGGMTRDHGAPPSADELGTEWNSFATAAVRLLEVVVTARDPDRFTISNPDLFQPVWVRHSRPDRIVDACLAALERSLNREGGCMVVQSLHISGLQTLGHIAHLSRDQARRIICFNGLTFGPAVLAIPHIDEESTICALWYIAALSNAHDLLATRRLTEMNAASVAEQAMARYPRSPVIEHEASRVLAACRREQPSVSKTVMPLCLENARSKPASAAARQELGRRHLERGA
jgi:hypothetical protein